jgi:cephalosporin hydroxylase
MIVHIDTESQSLIRECDGRRTEINLYSKEAFEVISQIWLKVGWNEKYPYTFSWMGRPIIQNPEDMIRAQEVIYQLRPDVIVETGIAHGGSLVFYASLCKAMGKGRVVGVDIEIRPHNRKAMENHEVYGYMTLVEGNSVDPVIVERVKRLVKPGETVIVLLDSNHAKAHVLAELQAYHGLVTPGSYIVATDGIMRDLHDVPRGNARWASDHPAAAAAEFVQAHPEFVIEQPRWPFNESGLDRNVTHWPDAWLRRAR